MNCFFENFFDKIENLAVQYSDITVLGDFNNNIFEESHLVSTMQTFGLHLINSDIPTHYTTTAETLIDLIFASSRENILLYD